LALIPPATIPNSLFSRLLRVSFASVIFLVCFFMDVSLVVPGTIPGRGILAPRMEEGDVIATRRVDGGLTCSLA
jgi:hypothetical protein